LKAVLKEHPLPFTPTTAELISDFAETIVGGQAPEGEIMEPDRLAATIHEVDNMSKEAALDEVGLLVEQTGFASFRLGGVLSLIQKNGWHKPLSFPEFVEKKHGLKYRKAMYYIAIYDDLSQSGVPWSKVKDIGWTKLKEIAKILTQDKVDEWVQRAKSNNTDTLISLVKVAKNGTLSLEDQQANTVTAKTFKVHEGQKQVIEAALDKAKALGETTIDTVALEYIASDYLAGGNAKIVPPAALTFEQYIDAALAMHGGELDALEKVLQYLQGRFPEYVVIPAAEEVPA